MRHVSSVELAASEIGSFAPESATTLDNLSRELAMAAANGDVRVQLLNAMQMLGNIRDLLVGPLSAEAERLLDEAIQQLMRRERDIPAEWRAG